MPNQEAKTEAQAQMLANRLQKRFRHLSKWAKRIGAGAFRLYDRDIPEIPLVLDYYGEAVAGALYKRPYEKDEEDERRWLEAMRAAAAEVLSIDPRNIFLKRRERQRGSSQYEKIGERRFVRNINEGGLSFKVNLSDYLDTGLFLDRRLLRSMIRDEARGKRVLNLFSYTGAFSVYAAAGGAASTDSVDLSNTYLDWAKENFALNGFTAEKTDGKDAKYAHNNLIRADALAFLERSSAAGQHWDLIILDPPAFSNSKKMIAALDLQRDHTDLISRCLALLGPGGKLWFSANQRSFKTTAVELEATLAPRFPGVKVTDVSDKTVDEDFRGKKTPGSFVLAICGQKV
ncbi:rRNA (guanine-N2)-methyltransferase [Spirochaetia bacterium]|nr:rRNA (guanine-N2)-methyltransferase [Spirochaetia bacterium]